MGNLETRDDGVEMDATKAPVEASDAPVILNLEDLRDEVSKAAQATEATEVAETEEDTPEMGMEKAA